MILEAAARALWEVAVQRRLQLSLGIVLFILSASGFLYACRVTRAQVLYREAKYGAPSASPQETLELCEQSHRLYRRGYYLCIWAAETAYLNRNGPDGGELRERVAVARRWCDRGLMLNPYDAQLRELKARLLARDSVAAAAAYWERHVDWNFWDPWNHAVLAELYAGVGEYGRALESLEWAKGSASYAVARKRVLDAWRYERRVIAPGGRPPERHPR